MGLHANLAGGFASRVTKGVQQLGRIQPSCEGAEIPRENTMSRPIIWKSQKAWCVVTDVVTDVVSSDCAGTEFVSRRERLSGADDRATGGLVRLLTQA